MMLLNEAESIHGTNYPETEVFHIMISTFKSNMSDFLSQAEQYCDELNTMLNLCHFCERVSFPFFYQTHVFSLDFKQTIFCICWWNIKT